MAAPNVTVVLPAHNERAGIATAIAEVYAALEPTGRSLEVVVVDDGSDDGTDAAVEALIAERPTLRLVRLSRNFGKESALAAGLAAAAGDHVALLDADLQDPPQELVPMLAQAEAGFDVVYGVRRSRRSGLVRWLGYRLFYRLLRLVSDLPMPLDTGDFCVLSRRVVQVLEALPERSRFLRGLRTWVGFRQCGHLYDRPARQVGETKYSLADLCDLAVLGFLSSSRRPLAVAFFLGLALVVVGLVALALLQPASLVVALELGGVQLVMLGVLGAYLGRVLDQVEGRPRYVVERTVNCDAPLGPR